MKKLLIFLFFISELCYSQGVGTTIIGGCSTVSVVAVPNYQHDLIIGGGFKPVNPCLRLVTDCSPNTFTKTRHWLQVYDFNTLAWNTIQGPIVSNSAVFNGLIHGTYRVMTQIPTQKFLAGCENYAQDNKCVTTETHLGWTGEFKTTVQADYSSTIFYSNEVPVGLDVASDIAYNFLDGDGNNLNDFAFDFNEIVRMNANSCKNYNAWFLAIFEQNGQQRYRSKGWTAGKAGIIDLTDFWAGGTFDDWKFETFGSYVVQFAIVNDQCQIPGQWMNLDKSFFICPAGTGCKFKKPVNSLSVYPNPVRSEFRISGLDFNPINKFEYVIQSLEGKIVKKDIITDPSRHYSTSDLESGIYLITVLKDDVRILNSKISILK